MSALSAPDSRPRGRPPARARLLERGAFRDAVFARDAQCCVLAASATEAAVGPCAAGPLDAHHLLDRALWEDGGYYLDNGVSLCGAHHLMAEQTRVSVETLRRCAGIATVHLPPSLSADERYDKWGNVVLADGRRLRGPLFEEPGARAALRAGQVLEAFTHWVKYPRTPHLQWSTGASSDDAWAGHVDSWEGTEVVATLKLDGENTSVYHDTLHARGITEMRHPSQTWAKAWHARVRHELPERWRFVVENVSAVHTIRYTNLESYFYLTSVWDEHNRALSWDDTVAWAELLDLPTAPLLYRGVWDAARIRALAVPVWDGNPMEGYVVRPARAFRYAESSRVLGKYVDARFRSALEAGGDTHWAHRRVEWNGLTPAGRARVTGSAGTPRRALP